MSQEELQAKLMKIGYCAVGISFAIGTLVGTLITAITAC